MIIGAVDTRRPGASSVLMLLVVPIVLVLAGLVAYVGLTRDAHSETQNAADAAALAAAWNLATDDLLTNSELRAIDRLGRSRAAARALAQANVAGGQPLDLDENKDFDPEGDIVFGSLDRPWGTFTPTNGKPASWTGSKINAVRVTIRRDPVVTPMGGPKSDRDVIAKVTAMLDWSVVGFRPNDDLPIPLMPLGVYTDHVGTVKDGWDARRLVSPDKASFDPKTKLFTANVADGIPEVAVVIGKRSSNESLLPPVVFLKMGSGTPAKVVEQVGSGIGRMDFNGDFVLIQDNTLDVLGSPDCPDVGTDARALLDKTLQNVVTAGEPRIWPLFSGFNETTGVAKVSGWMSARIVSVSAAEGGGIKLILQPAVVSHTAAVTEQRKDTPAFWANNRTICRVRLAD